MPKNQPSKRQREEALKIAASLTAIRAAETMTILEKAHAVGLSAARAVHLRGDTSNGDIEAFRQIIDNRLAQSKEIGPPWAHTAEEAYWMELCRLEGLRGRESS